LSNSPELLLLDVCAIRSILTLSPIDLIIHSTLFTWNHSLGIVHLESFTGHCSLGIIHSTGTNG
jgi:hypothetical protein